MKKRFKSYFINALLSILNWLDVDVTDGLTLRHYDLLQAHEELESAYSKKSDELWTVKRDYEKYKSHCDEIANRILVLEEDQRNVALNGMDLQVQKLSKNDKIVCITTRHKSLLDHKMYARISHILRTKCDWLDLIFMMPEDVKLLSMTDEDLKDMGLQRLPKDNTEYDEFDRNEGTNA